MASIQDIQALEERIYDAVQDYIDYPDGYEQCDPEAREKAIMEWNAMISQNSNDRDG